MSWAEVMKINDNVTKPLNQQIREARFSPFRIITATGTYTPEKTGLYKVICVGAGGAGSAYSTSAQASGGGGGVAIKTLRLLSTTSYNVTVSTTASFAYNSTALTATPGGDGSASGGKGGTGGTASGGDSNYTGASGTYLSKTNGVPLGGSVGVYISELMTQKSSSFCVNSNTVDLHYGTSILGYGGGAAGAVLQDANVKEVYQRPNGLPAAVIIIPLEMEE